MRDQLLSLLWIKFLVLRHTWTTTKSLSVLISGLMLAFVALFGIAVSVGLFFVSRDFGADFLVASPEQERDMIFLLVVFFDGAVMLALMLWFAELSLELQRSDIIDFRKFLYLPVSMRMVFTMNFLYSMASPVSLLFLVPLVGAFWGLSASMGPHMLLGIPVGIVFFVMAVAWLYFIRGFLTFLMQNKRRRRLLLGLVPVVLILLFQVPYLSMSFLDINSETEGIDAAALTAIAEDTASEAEENVNEESQEVSEFGEFDSGLKLANMAVPLGWFPLSIRALVEGRFGLAGVYCTSMAAFAAFGMGLGYRSTFRFYTGASRSTGRSVRTKPAVSRLERRRLIDRSLPLVDDEVSAVAVAGFLNYIRHPMIPLQMVTPLILVVLFAGMRGFSTAEIGDFSSDWVSTLMPLSVIGLPFLFNIQFFANIFGIDQAGFQTYVLLPNSRAKYLLGKNIAIFPFVGGSALILYALSTLLIDYRPVVLLTTMFYLVQLHLLFCIVGNLVSLYFPYRIGHSLATSTGSFSMKNRFIMMAMGPVAMVLMAIMLLPATFGIAADFLLERFWGYQGVSVGLIAAVVMFIITVLAYRASLRQTGDLLSRREQFVLEKLLKDKE